MKSFSTEAQSIGWDSEVPEFYLDKTSGTPGAWVRGMEIQLISSLASLQYPSIADLCAIALVHPQYLQNRVDFNAYPFVSLKTIFASMMELAFMGVYDESLVVDNGDFALSNATAFSGGQISWINGYIMYSWLVSKGNLAPYTSWNQIFTYYDNMQSPLDLLKHICAEFGVVPRYSFGNSSGLIDPVSANNKHRISFNTRGNSGNSITPVGNIIKSVENPQTSRNVQRLYVSQSLRQVFEDSFFWDGVLYGTPHLGGNPDSWRQFDKTIQFDFVSLANLGSAVQPIFVVDPSITAVVGGVTYVCAFPADLIYYWNYQSSYQSSDTYFGYALLQYYFYRYTGRLEYDRIYGSLQANQSGSISQIYMQNLQQHSINDGITGRNFYATEIHKDVLKNQVEVIWIQS